MSRVDFAKLLGVTFRTIGRWERDYSDMGVQSELAISHIEHMIKTETIKQWAKKCGVECE